MFDDGPCCAERIAADTEDDRVAAPEDARGVGKYVRAPLEDEAHDTERRCVLGNRPPFVFDAIDNVVSTAGLRRPPAQTGDHLAAHLRREDQTGGRPAAGFSNGDIPGVRCVDRTEDGIVVQGVGEPHEEVADLLIAAGAQQFERRLRR